MMLQARLSQKNLLKQRDKSEGIDKDECMQDRNDPLVDPLQVGHRVSSFFSSFFKIL